MSANFQVQGERFSLKMDGERYGTVLHISTGWGRNIWALDPDVGCSLNSISAWRGEECVEDGCTHSSSLSAAECTAGKILRWMGK